ncbi:MAG: 5'-methylthioadenosine/S-adenosylhomocysteine nucleosidase [Bacteroidales bacterium]|nr:5'-methylthioadenosine/S-adenosylhomocysteine nucleosidase [Bacteroidales bacterium]MBQ5639719.1 5'-methylthioadenosine/S-adenosylhomocysteine nucleosidase [Bacteroidales bacterium]
MYKIGIICAMQSELELLSRQYDSNSEHIRCVLSGIGKVNAAMAASTLIDSFKPDCMLSIGVAGSFAEGIVEGDVVIASETAYHDVWCGEHCSFGQVEGQPQRFACDSKLLSKATAALPEARVGLNITGDQFYISMEEDARQKNLYPDALSIDMEAAAVAQVCRAKDVPFLAVKIISDQHNDDRQAERYADFWDNMADKSFTVIKKIINSL